MLSFLCVDACYGRDGTNYSPQTLLKERSIPHKKLGFDFDKPLFTRHRYCRQSHGLDVQLINKDTQKGLIANTCRKFLGCAARRTEIVWPNNCYLWRSTLLSLMLEKISSEIRRRGCVVGINHVTEVEAFPFFRIPFRPFLALVVSLS